VKLHSPAFEKSLRRRVKITVRGSPQLRREYRAAKKAVRRHLRVDRFIRPIASLALGFFVGFITQATGHPLIGLAIISFWGLITWSLLAQNILTLLYQADDIPALAFLPVSEIFIFRWEMQKFFRQNALPSLLDQIAGFGALALYLHFSWAQWILAMVLAVFAWLLLLALALFCAVWFPRLKYTIISSCLMIFVGLGAYSVCRGMGPVALHFMDGITPSLNVILPTGWVPSLFQLFLSDGSKLVTILIIPIALMLSTVRNSIELLRSRLQLREYLAPEATDQVPEAADRVPEKDISSGAAREEAARVTRLGITAIEEIIQSRQFLLPVRSSGWVENHLWNWLTPRERSVAEFAFPSGYPITKPWLKIFRNSLLAVLLGFACGQVNQTLGVCTFVFGLIITACQILGQVWTNGAAFESFLNNGINLQRYVLYPVTFTDLSRTLFKSSVIQLPFLTLYTVACLLLFDYLNAIPLTFCLVIGLKAGPLVFASRFITIALAFSSGTNDSARWRFRNFALVFLFIGGAITFVGLGGTGLFISNTLLGWLLWLAALLDAYVVLRIYGWFYHANCFDLMIPPRR
jgi:hypothetical protein